MTIRSKRLTIGLLFLSSPIKNKIVFQVKENTTGADRTATITVLVGDKTAGEIAVTQRVNISYILPFIEFGKVIDDIKNFEKRVKAPSKVKKI